METKKTYFKLGPIVFDFLNSPTGSSEKHSREFAVLKPLGGYPQIQDMGDNLSTRTLTWTFHSAFCNPAERWGQIQAHKEECSTLPLVYASGFYPGVYKIKDASKTDVKTDGIGNLIMINVEIELIRVEEPDPDETPTDPGSPEQVHESAPDEIDVKYLTPADIARQNAENT